MQYTSIGSYKISRLALGTVQLGMNYGVSNAQGKPPLPVAFDILQTAFECGINTLDTSRSYGTAEHVIGDFFERYEQRLPPVVVTKCKLASRSAYSLESTREEIYRSVQESLLQLKISRIPVLLFHNEKDQHLEELVMYLTIIFQELKEEGLLGVGGISAYAPEDVDFVLDNSVLEVVQVPLNVFDLRLINNGKLARLKQQQKIVVARSVFLQGLFFLDPSALPETLAAAKPFLLLLHRLAADCGLSVPELAFAFVKDLEGVSSLLFGATCAEQVKENRALLDKPALPTTVINAILDFFADVPNVVITPGLWQR